MTMALSSSSSGRSEGWVTTGDVLFGIRYFRPSSNVAPALRAAREMEIVTVGLLGGAAEPALGLCDHLLLVPDLDGTHIGMPHGVGSHRARIAPGPPFEDATLTNRDRRRLGRLSRCRSAARRGASDWGRQSEWLL